MKKFFTLLCTVGAFSAYGQITLDQQSYAPSYIGLDTLKRTNTTGVTYPNLAPAINGSWDLTGLSYTSASYTEFKMGMSDPAFPGAQQYDSLHYSVTTGVGYDVNWVSSISAGSYSYLGERIFRQAIPIGFISFDPNDSLVFTPQNILYSSPRTEITFPATMGSKWSCNYSYTTDFELTVNIYGFLQTPCQRKTYVTIADTVVGWGKIKVKDYNGNASGNMNVLMLRRTEVVTDSFFISGVPADPQLLTAFGISQGMQTTIYEDRFLRTQEIIPVVSVRYNNNSFAQNQISYVQVHTNRLQDPTSVVSLSKHGKLTLYPNPLTGRQLTVSLEDKSVQSLHYDIMNIQGQVVAQGDLNMNSGRGYIGMDGATAAGIYYIRLYEDGQLLSTLPLSIN